MAILTTIWWFLKRVAWFAYDNWKVVLPAVALLVAVIWFYGWCGRGQARLDQQEIIKAQQAIRENDRKEMIEILVNSDVREKQIDANVANGRTQVMEAANTSRKEHAGKSNEDLAAELERRAKE